MNVHVPNKLYHVQTPSTFGILEGCYDFFGLCLMTALADLFLRLFLEVICSFKTLVNFYRNPEERAHI
jgi:hypothetical protein